MSLSYQPPQAGHPRRRGFASRVSAGPLTAPVTTIFSVRVAARIAARITARITALVTALITVTTLAVTLAVPASPARAAGYPERPLRLVVAFAPGGIADQAARAISEALASELGQAVVIENRGGAGGNIGASLAARAAGDGYTVLVTTTSVVVNPALYDNPGYELARELVPVIEIATSANVIAAHPGFGAKTLAEAIEKARSGQASFGSPGNGSTSHLTGEYLLNSVSKADVRHVPYRGGALAVADTLGGQTPLVVVPVPVAAQHVKAGTLVPLAVTSVQRYPGWPEVATVAESGFPGYVDATWVGAFAPAGTPPAIVDTLNRKIAAALARDEVRARLVAAGLEPRGGAAADFGAYVRDEVARWKAVVEKTGVKAEQGS